jgi:hypothetical protein
MTSHVLQLHRLLMYTLNSFCDTMSLMLSHSLVVAKLLQILSDIGYSLLVYCIW